MAAESSVVKNDRRERSRLPAFCAVELSSPAKRGRCGVTRNATERGLLIVTPSRFGEGDRLELSVRLRGLEAKRSGRVVRVDVNPVAANELWRYRVAVALDESLPSELLEDAVVAARESQMITARSA